MTGEQAFKELVDEGYLYDNGTGWCRVIKPPDNPRELAWFVRRIKTLGAYAVDTSHSEATIEICTGTQPDEVLFRLFKP